MSDSQKWLTLVMLAALGFIIYLLQPILMPFLVGILLAYLASPLVDRLTHWRIPRILSVCIVFFGITLLFILMVGGLVPGIKNQIVYLNTRMPEFIKWANFQAIPWVERNFQINFKHLDLSELTDSLGKSWQEAGTIAGTVLSHIALSGMSIIGSLASIALIPVVTFYMMVDWNRLLSGMEDLLPRQFQPRVHSVMKECNEVIGAFFRGQFLVMISLGVIYTLGLKLVGLEIGVIVGLIAGIGSIIPYFGFTIGIVIATIAAIFQFQEFLPVVWVWTIFGIAQFMESWVLIPYLVGNKVGLHPVLVIFSILAGGQLFGFFGMLLAIPMAAVILVLLRHVRRHYIQSDLYTHAAETSVIIQDQNL